MTNAKVINWYNTAESYVRKKLKKKNLIQKCTPGYFVRLMKRNFGVNFYLFKIKFRGCSSVLKFVIVAGNQID